jgi:O-antigen/teichoic acid export membrane protein
MRNVAIVASGTAAAQAISMASAPVITRLYGPEAYGLLGVFVALVAIMTPIAALTYPIAIVLPKEDADAKGLAKLSFFIALAISALVAIALLIGGEWLLALLGSEAITAYAMLVPLSMLFSACMQISQQWLIRKKQYSITARVAILQSLILNSAKAGIGWFNPIGAVLVVLATAGHALHAVMLWTGINRSTSLQNAVAGEGHPKATLKELAKRHYDFPLYRAPQTLINAVSQSLPVLMLAAFFGPAAAGFYTLGKTVMGMPSILIGKSVGDVFYPRITEAAHNGENLKGLIVKATIALAAVGFVPFGLVVAFGPWLFGLVFGGEWVVAGEYARWLAAWLYFGFLNRPSVAAIATLSLQGFFLIHELLSVFARVIALVIGFYFFSSDILAISLFSIVGLLSNTFLIAVTYIKAKSIQGLTDYE